MEITVRALNELRPYEHNPKTHPKSQVDNIARSIQDFGFRQPLVIDGDAAQRGCGCSGQIFAAELGIQRNHPASGYCHPEWGRSGERTMDSDTGPAARTDHAAGRAIRTYPGVQTKAGTDITEEQVRSAWGRKLNI